MAQGGPSCLQTCPRMLFVLRTVFFVLGNCAAPDFVLGILSSGSGGQDKHQPCRHRWKVCLRGYKERLVQPEKATTLRIRARFQQNQTEHHENQSEHHRGQSEHPENQKKVTKTRQTISIYIL